MQGYVYVLTNVSMPGLVKIGRTSRDVIRRSDELWTTGVPTPFEVFYSVLCPNCVEVEANLHSELAAAGQRVSSNREFFRALPGHVATRVLVWQMRQVHALVQPFMPEHCVISKEIAFGASDVKDALSDLDLSYSEVGRVIGNLKREDLEPAVARFLAERAKAEGRGGSD